MSGDAAGEEEVEELKVRLMASGDALLNDAEATRSMEVWKDGERVRGREGGREREREGGRKGDDEVEVTFSHSPAEACARCGVDRVGREAKGVDRKAGKPAWDKKRGDTVAPTF